MLDIPKSAAVHSFWAFQWEGILAFGTHRRQDVMGHPGHGTFAAVVLAEKDRQWRERESLQFSIWRGWTTRRKGAVSGKTK
jgi:hypothetical protein